MTTGQLHSTSFNQAYADASVYDAILPPHFYLGVEDVQLLERVLQRALGAPPSTPTKRTLDIGAGPGRMTHPLIPYARTLHGTDVSAGMVSRFADTFPQARTTVADTETLLAELHAGGESGGYDLISASWTLNYPLLECFEKTSAEGVTAAGDFNDGVRRVATLVDRLVGLLAEDGHLFAMFFDAETEEQRLVTSLWESVSPFPGTGRGYTWELLRDGLFGAERARRGRLAFARVPGWAVCADVNAAEQWFLHGHLNSYPGLIDDPQVRGRIREFAAGHVRDDGRVHLPSGMYVVHFHASFDTADATSIL